MKLGILADIHEQYDELRKAIDILRRNGADCFNVLGDVCEIGKRMEETVALLRDVAAIGVWGNHDIGLCFEPTETIREKHSKAVLDFMGSLHPRLEIEGCLFTHVEPWLDPNKIEDLWYFDGPPDTQEKLDWSFAAMPNRVMFTGHHHRWLLGSTAGMIPWNGEGPIKLDTTKQHLVVVNAVFSGHCALFDTTSNELIPFRVDDMNVYTARYNDRNGEEHTSIHNDGKTLAMTIRGVEFEGSDFDMLEPKGTLALRNCRHSLFRTRTTNFVHANFKL